MTKQQKRNRGFTIIEVLIVLAIAALILLIVFLAVPALERGSRNNQRKNDASAVASAVANFISNNGGTLPSGVTFDTNAGSIDLCDSSGGGVGNNHATGRTAACTGNFESAKLGYYAQSGGR